MSWEVRHGDCLELMGELADSSVDAVVTDPPYGIGFMGKTWDAEAIAGFQVWCEAWATEALRVLKPGGHLLVFGGTRTYHRLAAGVEDAGFEIRDTICWLYGSGFPKSLDVSKAIDKAAGAEPDRITENESGSLGGFGDAGWNATPRHLHYDNPQTPAAERWQGWGTALKPAHEPVVVARKPLSGTVSATVLEHGTGALNVDGCRVEHAGADDLAASRAKNPGRDDLVSSDVYGDGRPQQSVNAAGRWPANVVLDEEAARLLDEQSGEQRDGVAVNRNRDLGGHSGNRIYGARANGSLDDATYGAGGGASRFFYTAKASRSERERGLEGFEERDVTERHAYSGLPDARMEYEQAQHPAANVHPTVKPIALMRWLIRLVTPPGGTVLDPFTGSGTTGCAAALEDVEFVGIEREAEYVAIAEARIAYWADPKTHEARRAAAARLVERAEAEANGEPFQLDLLSA